MHRFGLCLGGTFCELQPKERAIQSDQGQSGRSMGRNTLVARRKKDLASRLSDHLRMFPAISTHLLSVTRAPSANQKECMSGSAVSPQASRKRKGSPISGAQSAHRGLKSPDRCSVAESRRTRIRSAIFPPYAEKYASGSFSDKKRSPIPPPSKGWSELRIEWS